MSLRDARETFEFIRQRSQDPRRAGQPVPSHPSDQAQARPATEQNIAKVVMGVEARFERLIRDLDHALIDRHGERGRQELRNLRGEIKVEADVREIRFYNEQDRHEAALLRAVGTVHNCGSGGGILKAPLLRFDPRPAAGPAPARRANKAA